jgi:hypothetical protein
VAGEGLRMTLRQLVVASRRAAMPLPGLPVLARSGEGTGELVQGLIGGG